MGPGPGSGSGAASATDVWCAPGIAFGADARPVDCVVAHHPVVARPRADSERVHRERTYNARRGGDQDHISSFIDSSSALDEPLFGSDLLPPGHLRRFRGYRRSPGGLEEIMMFQTRLLLGRIDSFDQYRDLRLDVDNMTYEELLELGDKIGNVNTGLREEEIFRNLRKIKPSILDASPLCISTEAEWKCSICQEEYEGDDEIGKLECGHSYHIYCIKQWLLQKNACPVCKTAVTKS
ncbi:Zinc finger RING/FYVE/PHD-type protein [Dioscorea alata]|uniref:Zinc finger RING/FYVE/PHD-type protein n=1 Tax=Dioscorea alata TaxID=55571 RepID=A0ACB7UDN1_DIOAL|nr:Zinc finger RING/FYVE/PHD-type protein [Dioscorea alata]